MTRVLGPLNDTVLVDGHTRQAHIDHFLPCRSSTSVEQSDNTMPVTASPQKHVTSPEMEPDDTIVPLSFPLQPENNDAADTPQQELVTLRPIRDRHPPQRLIEEMS